MKYFISALVAGAILIGGIFYGHTLVPAQLSGSTAFTAVSGKTYYLSGAGISSFQNTITLASFTLPDPNNTPIQSSMFSGTQYGVLEAQTSKTEDVTFTGVTQNGNGTATLTGVTRGISFYSPFVASTTLQLAHAGGATFILSNPAAFYAQFLTNTNSSSIYGTFTFSSTSPPVYDADPIWANFSTQALADVAYVNSVVAAGCANGSTTVKGCVQIATARQAASSTINGSTGAIDVLQSSYATDTPSISGCATSSGGCVVMSLLNGKLNQAWLDLTQAFTWSGLQTFSSGFIDNASSTFISTANLNGAIGLNKIAYTFPSSQGNSGTFLQNNGSGTLSWSLPYIQSLYSSSAPFSASSTAVIPAGIFLNSEKARIDFSTNGFGPICLAIGSGSATTTIACVSNNILAGTAIVVPNGSSAQITTGLIDVSGTMTNLAVSSSFNSANPIYIQMGSASGNINNFQVTLTTQ